MLSYLGDDGVSESSQSVQFGGYPMSHSTHAGFSHPPVPPRWATAVASVIDRFAPDGRRPPSSFAIRCPVASLASGVGQYEQALTCV
jgi:hypothetical protein